MSYWNPMEDGQLIFNHQISMNREPTTLHIYEACCWCGDQAIIFRTRWIDDGTTLVYCFTNSRDALLFKLTWG